MLTSLFKSKTVTALATPKSFLAVVDDIRQVVGDAPIMFGSMIDHVHNAFRTGVRYIVGDNDFYSKFNWIILKQICDKDPCISVTHWWRRVAESHGVRIVDVVPHAISPLPVEPTHKYDAVYLNAHYVFAPISTGVPTYRCERKGWYMWPEVAKRLADYGYTAMGYVSGRLAVSPYNKYNNVVFYGNVPREKVYEMIGSGKVYVNLSGQEGFGMNPLTALYMKLRVVTLDVEYYRETMGDAPGVYWVQPDGYVDCNVAYSLIVRVYYADPQKFVEATLKALEDWEPNEEGRRYVMERYPPDVYKRFLKFLS